MFDLNGPDRPDLPEDGIVDVGALIEEHLALAVDPYPRSEGAEIPAEYRSPAVGADDSPFSTLLGLRTDARSLGETRPKSKD